ncbi:A-kinase anchor protein 10, mitochondrial [Ilyodon furcidens]|uniref:A-kinase anchor protein 10, mitochondrial n=1 Tax=Ilyodon furcidens TaxID=33524 RepID=A0ABV0UKX4_9TELE
MSFFKRKAKSKEPERVTDAKVNKVIPQSPSQGPRNHNAVVGAAGPSHVAISAISANMDSFARGRTAILKKQPSHMEAAHFGDLGTEQTILCLYYVYDNCSWRQRGAIGFLGLAYVCFT